MVVALKVHNGFAPLLSIAVLVAMAVSLLISVCEKPSGIREEHFESVRTSSAPSSGIGIIGLKFRIDFQKPPEIETVFPEVPAAQGQLKAGDLITQVDGVPTDGLSKEEIYEMIIGAPDTKVMITIRRGNATFVKMLTRMDLNNFAKSQPSIWKMYQSDM